MESNVPCETRIFSNNLIKQSTLIELEQPYWCNRYLAAIIPQKLVQQKSKISKFYLKEVLSEFCTNVKNMFET